MCVNFPQTSLLFRFQSAPRSEERGDTTPHFLEFMGRGVSIRAPLRRAGRCHSQLITVSSVHVSIRAPLRRAGRC